MKRKRDAKGRYLPHILVENGSIFGKLVVVSSHFNRNRTQTCICKCKCGNEVTVLAYRLTSGKKLKSCGCLQPEISREIGKRTGPLNRKTEEEKLKTKEAAKLRKRPRKWTEESRSKRRVYLNNYKKNRYQSDINYRLAGLVGARIRGALKGNKKERSITLLGCSPQNFRIYIETKWETGMSWANYGNKKGQWNFDHIMPISIFDLTKPQQQHAAFHFSNIQPMWAEENLKKSNNIIYERQEISTR